MTENNERDNIPQQPKLCSKCHIMYGHISFNHMCSKCFKQQTISQAPKEAETPVLKPSVTQQPQKILPPIDLQIKSPKRCLQRQQTQQVKIKKGRCTKCNKKTGMLGYDCKHCTHQFCSVHRLPQDHNCSIDFISLGKKKIKLQNPVINVKKIEDI